MLIVGSEALKRIFPESRYPADLDLIVPHDKIDAITTKYLAMNSVINTIEEKNNFISIRTAENKRIEIFIAVPGNAMWMYLERYNAFDGEQHIDVHGLYSMKKSHIHIPLKFNKHIRDYCLLHKKVNGIDIMPEITKHNTKDIKERLGKKFKSPSLNKSVKDFFAQSEGHVISWFIHDDIHKAMAHYDNKPLYERMQKDLSQAWCEKDLWNQFSFEDKCKTVLEEAYVIALERKIIPLLYGGHPGYHFPKEALEWSMMRVCTTLTGGWFRQFATDNYIDIMDRYADLKFAEKFLEKVKNGEIKFKEEIETTKI